MRWLLLVGVLLAASCRSGPHCPEDPAAETTEPVAFFTVPGKNKQRIVAYVRTNEDYFEEYETCRPWLTLADHVVDGAELAAGEVFATIYWNAGEGETPVRVPWDEGSYIVANCRLPRGASLQSYELARGSFELFRLRSP